MALLYLELGCNVTHVHIIHCKFNFMGLGSTGNGGIFLVWTAQNKYAAVRKGECVSMAMQAFVWLNMVQFRGIQFGTAWPGSVLHTLI